MRCISDFNLVGPKSLVNISAKFSSVGMYAIHMHVSFEEWKSVL